MGVNTFRSSKGSPTVLPAVRRMIRATEEEKEAQDLSRLSGIVTVENLQKAYTDESATWLRKLQAERRRSEVPPNGKAAIKNMFEMLMEATKYCSLGQLTAAMFEVGGQYRRNM
ncbi:MAG: hypothetical protein IPI81_00370 [Flavobacteriales bacterium]|nr:hypothetical protein [Flavobacteriales bacterium]MCC6939421.1 hypothetical protein [Flavobacteriales bacterium]